MPESSLAEEAAISPAGNVLAPRIPAGHATGVNVTGIPDRGGGQPARYTGAHPQRLADFPCPGRPLSLSTISPPRQQAPFPEG
jgi:hypothetical protein